MDEEGSKAGNILDKVWASITVKGGIHLLFPS